MYNLYQTYTRNKEFNNNAIIEYIHTSILEHGFTVTGITQERSGVELKLLDQRSLS